MTGHLLVDLATGLTDEQLVARAQTGDDAALKVLLRRYRRLTRAKTRVYFLVGADADDVEQESLIGLYKAVRDFRPDKQIGFRSFADLCVTRQVISAIKSATRHKHLPLNKSVSFSGAPVSGAGEQSLALEDLIGDPRCLDPADEVVSAERVRALRRAMAEDLSPFEVEVLRMYVAGQCYRDISQRLGRPTKAVDNALQRIKRKLDQQLEDQPEPALARAS